jgi:ribosomal protein S18 acetylase RimI-like enzyme
MGISQLSVEGIRDGSGWRSGIQYSPRMSVEVEAVGQVTGELVEAVGRLLSQLSSSAGPLSADGLTRIVTHDATTLFVARSQGAIVGMLTLVTFPLPSGLRARIEDVVVDQAVRGQGIGTALTNAALRLAQQQGARSVDLTSRPSRVAANRLYQQLGFQLRDSNVYRHQPGAGAEEEGSRGR